MFDIGLQEMLVLGVLALLVFGPSKLPELGRKVGRAMREFRRASEDFRSTVETNFHLNESDPIIAPPTPAPVDQSAVPGDATLPSEVEPPVTGDEGPTRAEASEPTGPYCARQGSPLFHRSDCSWVKRIPDAERIDIKTVADARDQGFVTCPVCEPWEAA